MKVLFSTLLSLLFIMTIQSQELELELVASGFDSPLEIKHAGDDRLFIVEQGGQIKILNSDGSVNTTPFLNISSQVSSGGERGLLGLAFHPDYASNGFFYVNYTNTNGNTQISRFSVSGDPDIANPASELQMLSFSHGASNHNGGHLAFGPDGKLFIATGDGGGGGDPQNNSQTLSTYSGKILRLDVDLPAPYIPADNPFVDDPDVLDEIWAYGVRNPWKFSFDNETDDIWIADVGEFSWEEINKEPSDVGGLNYGWRCYEGNNPFNTNGCPPVEELTFPYAEYSSSGSRCSVTGGYVYRGAEFPAIQGLYFFADLCTGEIGTINQEGDLTFHGPFGFSLITSFGVDVDNNLYLASFGSDAIYKVIDNTLGVSDYDENIFLIYPNPAKTKIQIKSGSQPLNSFDIFDIKGRSVTSGTFQGNSNVIDVSQFKSGVYFVNVKTTEGMSQVKKLIKK
tara:strand:+ start:51268 stop:52629 length:1362 start_codon:yes stop_codon:yes gene_type:complete